MKTDDDYLAEYQNYSGWDGFAKGLEDEHGTAHNFLADPSCTACAIRDLARATQDPIFFMIHGNVDRIWSKWQHAYGHQERLTPSTVYEGASANWPANWPLHPSGGYDIGRDVLDPWAGGGGYTHMGGDATPLRPWTSPDNQTFSKSYIDPTIVIPRGYESQDGATVY